MSHKPHSQPSSLTERIEQARIDAGLVKPEVEDSIPPGRGLSMGLELVVAVGVCTLAGAGLDRWLSTKPLFLLLGFALGLVAGFWSLYRASLGMSALSVGARKKGDDRVD